MESVGKFEFNRKDLIGHGAFAVVFKGRHKQRPELQVAVKCINKKNLSKSQSLLGKEIKILKELKHENIVGLLDFQDISGCVYLVMEYCNGGDLAEYLHCKGSLSEDTIMSFVQQVAGAMSVLRSKGIIHRDLKPQNILLSYSIGRRICIKLADFGFARYLQDNTMAATLCGSPMYMAPEVIMSQNYDAKADLWSVGTIIFQCLTGKAPFQASTPQELRLFYERNQNLSPNIPRETSSHLRHLLLGLLQRNHRDRMDFNEFFHHPFLKASNAVRKSSPVPMPSYPSSGSGSSSSGSSVSHITPTQSEAEPQKPHPSDKATPPSDSQIKDSSSETEDFIMVPAQFTSEMGEHASPDTGTQRGCSPPLGSVTFVGKTLPPSPSLRISPSPTRPVECCGSSYSQSVPVPVPTQIHNYQRMEQNLQGASGISTGHCCKCGLPGCGRRRNSPESGLCLSPCRVSAGGSRPHLPSPQVGTIPGSPNQAEPQCSRTGLQDMHVPQQLHCSPLFADIGAVEFTGTPKHRWHRHSPDAVVHREFFFLPLSVKGRASLRLCLRAPIQPLFPNGLCNLKVSGDVEREGRPNEQGGNSDPLWWELGKGISGPQTLSRTRTMPDLQESHVTSNNFPERRRSSVKRSSSAGRLSDLLLKAVVGSQPDRGSGEGLNTERPMDTTAPTSGPGSVEKNSGSPAHAVLISGSSPHGHTPPLNGQHRHITVSSCSPACIYDRFQKAYNYGYTGTMASNLHHTVFIPPELPEETLMEQSHTEMVSQLRFTLAFSHCVMEIATSRDSGIERSEMSDISFLEQSQVADRISQLSREWSCAEQLVLYMKCAELLSMALHTAMEAIKQDKLYPSVTVKQVVRKLNELYKACVMSCRSLTVRLQLFFSTKQRLMDRFNNITAEKIIYSYTIQMVQAAALDEMFHHGEASVQRYQKALLLMEGLSLIVTEKSNLNNVNKCKQCIERRLASLQSDS